jgi:cleavage and polyadenylation specificity factor subunit 3
MNKRKEPPSIIPVAEESDILKLTPLGAGNEVGRSCILLEFKGKKIMLDCGLHPAYTGLSALPFFDQVDPAEIDLILITHFHVDHAAGLPYFMEKTNFKGSVYMTHPTRAIYKWLLADYVKIASLSPEDQLYDEQDLARSYERIQVVDYHQQVDVGGIRFTPYAAGHVLGAAMFLIEIAGVRLLYTGDYSREEDRHLMAAEKPPNVVPEVLICESTFGVQSHEPRLDREARFTRMVHTIVKRGGRCLLPVFALGRAQELLLILDEYWQKNPELHNVPIYYASALAKKCMMVYQTYTNMMNARIREQAKTSNPFQFKHISNLKSIQQFDDVGPCVMMASPGMLQSGLSRELLELWCVDQRNGVIIPGYVVEGTLGRVRVDIYDR